jgi:hypothetical protein
VEANGAVVGDASMANFPTMSASSVTNTVGPIATFTTATLPAAPTNLSATAQAGPQVSLTWRDNANNENGFYVERCTGALAFCQQAANYAQIAVAPLKTKTGNTSFIDTTVAWGNAYYYRVAAFNGGGSSYAPVQPVPPSTATAAGVPATIPVLPAAPTSATLVVGAKQGSNYPVTLTWSAVAGATNFTIQRATNLGFTTGLTSFTAAGTATSLVQTVNRNTVYYYRIRANNNLGGSSVWTNALPSPIRTGP